MEKFKVLENWLVEHGFEFESGDQYGYDESIYMVIGIKCYQENLKESLEILLCDNNIIWYEHNERCYVVLAQ